MNTPSPVSSVDPMMGITPACDVAHRGIIATTKGMPRFGVQLWRCTAPGQDCPGVAWFSFESARCEVAHLWMLTADVAITPGPDPG